MIKRILLRSALNILTSILLSLVKSQDLQSILNKILAFVEKVVDALTDNDKNDKEQVLTIWQTERIGLALSAIELVEVVIKEKIENENLREAALIQVNSLKEILASLA